MYKWLTPDQTSEPTAVYAITLPTDPLWISAFFGAFYLLTQENCWEQHGNKTPAEMSSFWSELFDQFVNPPIGPIPM